MKKWRMKSENKTKNKTMKTKKLLCIKHYALSFVLVLAALMLMSAGTVKVHYHRDNDEREKGKEKKWNIGMNIMNVVNGNRVN